MEFEQLTLLEMKEVLKDRSVHAVSKKSGVSVTVLYKIIKGDKNFQCGVLKKLSDYLLNEYPESAWYLEG